jgi:hypothetical protein
MEEIIQKVPSISNGVLLHICRHFKSLPSEDVSKLLALGFKKAEIEQELGLVGSKFFSPPFSGIYDLVDFIEKNWLKKEVISLENDTLVSRWVWDKSEFPGGIGNDGLVSLKSLSENELSKVYKKDRKKFIVNAYPTSQIFPTSEFIVISKIKPSPEILTIYPGTYAPPFPSEDMDKDFYRLCDNFWKNHALIESI